MRERGKEGEGGAAAVPEVDASLETSAKCRKRMRQSFEAKRNENEKKNESTKREGEAAAEAGEAAEAAKAEEEQVQHARQRQK